MVWRTTICGSFPPARSADLCNQTGGDCRCQVFRASARGGFLASGDVLVRNGVIEWIGANGTAQLDSTDEPVEVDDGGLVALPALAEPTPTSTRL